MSDEREVIRQESFWFTATTLGFTGFVGALLKAPTHTEALIASHSSPFSACLRFIFSSAVTRGTGN